MTGNRPGQLKNLAQLPEFKIKKAGTNTPQIISATTKLDVTACATHLKIKIHLSEVTAFAMIDWGTVGNFMFEKFAKNHQIPGLLKKKSYQLTVVNETLLNQNKKMVKKETPPLKTQIND